MGWWEPCEEPLGAGEGKEWGSPLKQRKAVFDFNLLRVILKFITIGNKPVLFKHLSW